MTFRGHDQTPVLIVFALIVKEHCLSVVEQEDTAEHVLPAVMRTRAGRVSESLTAMPK